MHIPLQKKTNRNGRNGLCLITILEVTWYWWDKTPSIHLLFCLSEEASPTINTSSTINTFHGLAKSQVCVSSYTFLFWD